MPRIFSVAIGGGLGAVLRYLVQGWTQNRLGASFPYGTLLVNISGALLIGLLMTVFLEHAEISPQWRVFLVIGVLGGYTTFSSLTWEAYQLFAVGSVAQGCLYVGGSFFGGMIGLLAGVILGRLI
jgi:CrcB protein